MRDVATPRRGKRRGRGRRQPVAQPSVASSLDMGDVADLPVGVPFETRKRTWEGNRAYFEFCTSESSPVKIVPTPLTAPACSRSEEMDKKDPLNLGSEDESEDDDEDDAPPPPFIPRVARIHFEPTEEEEEEEIENEDSIKLVLQWPPPLPPPSPVVQPSPVQESSPIGVTMPNDLFHFEWEAYPDSPIPPERRRETFSIQSGPTAKYDGPYDAFCAIWDRRIMEHIAAETNKYAQQLAEQQFAAGRLRPNSRIAAWVDTDADEMYKFFAIILATGIVVKSRWDEYWNSSCDIFSTPGFRVEMTSNRFYGLSCCLHFNDNLTLNPEASRAEVKLHKLEPIIDHLNSKFQSLYTLGQNVSLDESLTQWKGWLDNNQCIKNKAASLGIKMYELCESQTGYLWRFKVHAGGEPEPSSDAGPAGGKIPRLVLELIDDLKHSGRTLWMDNFYNSPALARTLKSYGLDCVGTLRTNRQFVPVELSSLTKRDMTVGQVSGCTSGDVDLMVWRDKSRVGLISTYHGATITKHHSTLKPTVIYDYNLCMGGVDKKDQMLSMYPIERKRARVWYQKFFRRLLNTSVLNSLIMYNQSHSAKSLRLTHRAFRMNLIRRLLQVHQPQRVTTFASNLREIPSESDKRHVWRLLPHQDNSSGRRMRRKCVKCIKRTTTECVDCENCLCVACFILLHNYAPGDPEP